MFPDFGRLGQSSYSFPFYILNPMQPSRPSPTDENAIDCHQEISRVPFHRERRIVQLSHSLLIPMRWYKRESSLSTDRPTLLTKPLPSQIPTIWQGWRFYGGRTCSLRSSTPPHSRPPSGDENGSCESSVVLSHCPQSRASTRTMGSVAPSNSGPLPYNTDPSTCSFKLALSPASVC